MPPDSNLLSGLCPSAGAAQYVSEGRNEFVGRREQQFRGLFGKIVSILFDEAGGIILDWSCIVLDSEPQGSDLSKVGLKTRIAFALVVYVIGKCLVGCSRGTALIIEDRNDLFGG